MPTSELGPKLERLSTAVAKLSSFMDLNWYLGATCQAVVEGLGYKMAWIGLADFQSHRVMPLAQAGFEKGYLRTIEIRCDDTPLGRGPTGTAIRTGNPSVQNRIDTDPVYLPWRDEALNRAYRSSAAIPLRVNDEVLGALNVYSEDPNAFGPKEIQRLQSYANRASVAVKMNLTNQKLQTQLPEVKLPRYEFEASESYLVPEETTVSSFKMFEEHLLRGWQGLCITRQHPKQVRKRYDLDRAQVFWLTEEIDQNAVEDLVEISVLIGGFVNSVGSRIVLLDGLEYIVSRNGFESTYQFIQNQRSRVAATEAILLVTVHPQAFSEDKMALLKRELVPIHSRNVSGPSNSRYDFELSA
jgi:putative methionine-R-sulfoxide reductase with GAF domain